VAYAKGGGETPPVKPLPVSVIPISTATNTLGKPIPIPLRDPITIAITP
jgi:hypothetical protein